MAIALVQTPNSGTAIEINTMSATWGQATGAGNLLVTALAFQSDPGAVTAPAGGWTLGASTNNGTSTYLKVYYIANAASQSGSQSWSFVNSPNTLAMIIAEYSGLLTSSPLDQTGVNTGSSTTPATASVTTTNGADLLLAVHALVRGASATAATFSAPTNSFVLEKQDGIGQIDIGNTSIEIGFCDRIVSATAAYSSGVTSNFTGLWSSLFVSFKAVSIFTTNPFNLAPANIRVIPGYVIKGG